MILAKYKYYHSQFEIIPSRMEAGTPYESLKWLKSQSGIGRIGWVNWVILLRLYK